MALHRCLMLGTLATLLLLCLYVVVLVTQETTWDPPPLRFFLQGGSRPCCANQKPTWQQNDSGNWTKHTAGAHQACGPADHRQHRGPEQDGLDATPSIGPGLGGADQTRTEGPTPPRRGTTTEPPVLSGDVYLSEEDRPQSSCPDSVRTRVARTEFGERFLKNVPVLQWARHATRGQYERLRRYPGSHGWGGVDNETLLDSLSALNSSASGQLLDDWKDRGNGSECIPCAVVGNGGILKDSKKGKEIDSHHYVFRTNGVITAGFQEDVGVRTTHYTFSTNTLMNSLRSYAGAGYRGPPVSEETRYVFLPDHDRDYLLMKASVTHTLVERGPEQGRDPTSYFGKDVSVEKVKMYHPDFIRYLRNRFLRSSTLKTRFKDIYRPSTGAVMLLAALHTCDQVSVYGFMTPDYTKYSDHYYDRDHHPVVFYVNHDFKMEMALWQRLHQAGLIRLYMRQ
uniref:alpha-N-acetylgalactosaminide alpha-2,6-sialyltransferase n=1 Tax=Tetraodon nigroviridis TaxID=99883 RepID=H3BZW8_TETNG